MKIIQLTKGLETLIDDIDFERVSKIKWYASFTNSGKCYAKAKVGKKSVSLHRFLFNLEIGDKRTVDHINGKTLDNQKSINLRLCTHSDNCKNRYKPNSDLFLTSIYKGVCFKSLKQKWTAQITYNDETKHLGTFDDEITGALCYDQAARKYHREFAKLNFPEITEYPVFKGIKKTTSKYHGVCLLGNKWEATVWYNNKNTRLGRFKTELEAVAMYDAECIKLGLLDRLNFPIAQGAEVAGNV